MPVKKTYYPQKTFDEDFGAFVDMCVISNWEFPGITLKTLQDSIAAQRSERASHDAIELKYFKEHEAFGLAQASRHALFASALNAARGLFRSDKAVLAQLARFTVRRSRSKQPAAEGGSQPPPFPGRPPVTP